MQLHETMASLGEARAAIGGSLGLVIVYGPLHPGPLSLLRRARVENDAVAIAMITAPEAPGQPAAEPYTDAQLARDIDLLRRARIDLAFVPPSEELHPPDFATTVHLHVTGELLEHSRRPGYPDGMLTTVCRLLNVFRPARLYMGQKDAVEAALVRRMAADLWMPVVVVCCPTVREADGLALSRRNHALSGAERAAATVLVQALRAVRARFAAGERGGNVLRAAMRALVELQPLARLEYVSIADPDTLVELARVEGVALATVSIQIGAVSLHDNLLLGA